jgi:chaperonin GroES
VATTVRPLNDRLLVQELPRDMITPGGIYIPESSEMNTTTLRGRVVAIGPRVTDVAVDAVVLIGKYAGTSIKVDGVDMRMIRESEILAVE